MDKFDRAKLIDTVDELNEAISAAAVETWDTWIASEAGQYSWAEHLACIGKGEEYSFNLFEVRTHYWHEACEVYQKIAEASYMQVLGDDWTNFEAEILDSADQFGDDMLAYNMVDVRLRVV